MINRIDGNQYNDYNAAKTVNNIKDSGEKFSLNNSLYQKQDKQLEETGDKDNNPATDKTKARTTERSGVRLELSRDGQQAGVKRKQDKTAVNEHSQAAGQSFLDTVQKFITDFIQTVKEAFNRIWNEPQSEESVQSSDVTSEEAERYTEEYLTLKGLSTEKATVDKDGEIQKYLHSGNLDQVISLLTDNGQKTIAKNSTLLTYYDRNGRLTQINPSDRERILHGDRNTRKL